MWMCKGDIITHTGTQTNILYNYSAELTSFSDDWRQTCAHTHAHTHTLHCFKLFSFSCRGSPQMENRPHSRNNVNTLNIHHQDCSVCSSSKKKNYHTHTHARTHTHTERLFLTCGRSVAGGPSRWPAPSQPGRTWPSPLAAGPQTYWAESADRHPHSSPWPGTRETMRRTEGDKGRINWHWQVVESKSGRTNQKASSTILTLISIFIFAVSL